MVPVYLCDDDDRFRQKMEQEIKRHIIAKGYDMAVLLSTSNQEQLLESAIQKKELGIYFLDIVLSGSADNGLEVAAKLREHDTEGFIIYITSHIDFASHIFSWHIQALDVIVKDNDGVYTEVRQCLDVAAERIQTMDFKAKV